MKREHAFVWKVIILGAIGIAAIFFLVFDFANIVTWLTLNDPFQNQWTAVQLTDGEILYGRLSGVTGSTIDLRDVYSLDKVAPVAVDTGAGADQNASSTGGLSLGAPSSTAAGAQPLLIPVSDTSQIFINRAAVLYFKFVTADDPALPYLH